MIQTLIRSRLLLIPLLLGLVLVTGLMSPPVAFAIGETDSDSELPAFEETDWTPVYKGVGTGVGVLLAFFIMWFLVYPTILRRGRAWPVSLFGITTALAWAISWGIALSVYWEDLPIPPGETFWQGWGLRMIGMGILALFSTLCLVFWRSEPGRA